MARYISCKETAVLVREALKKAFKADFSAVRFSVRSEHYAGGASIDVRWTDGPTEKMVDSVVAPFRGASFDGMIDLMNYHTGYLDGEEVHFGADFISLHREFSPMLYTLAIDVLCARYCAPKPTLINGRVPYNAPSPILGDSRDFDWHLGATCQSLYLNRDGVPLLVER